MVGFNKKLTIIGGGNMGQAFAEGLLRNKVFSPANLMITDVNQDKLQTVQRKWKVEITTNNRQAVDNAETVLLAVKPQQLKNVLTEIKATLNPTTLLVSIAAGFTIDSIQKAINRKTQPIVRVMPNLAAKVGQSVSAWKANRAVNNQQKKIVKEMLAAIGTELEVETEARLDTITAVSGSGPAYFFYFVESLISGAKKLGLSEKEATQLALQTFYGAAELLKKDSRSPSQLRQTVTSKGGTTAAALKVFEEKKFSEIIFQALKAAENRAKELKQ